MSIITNIEWTWQGAQKKYIDLENVCQKGKEKVDKGVGFFRGDSLVIMMRRLRAPNM